MKSVMSPSLEDYLEAIYLLQLDSESVRITDLAQKMGVAKSSANNAVRSLSQNGLLSQQKYGTITLTEEGQATAQEVYFRHKTLTDFFITIVGVDPETAEKDACAIEHLISKQSFESILKMLKNNN